MPLSNRDGEPVDPVPYFVVTGLGALVAFSFLPGYGMAFGLPVWVGLALAAVVTLAFAAGAYHRMVLTYRPSVRRDVPPDLRLRKMAYAVLAVCCLLGGLSLPLLAS